MAPLGPLQLASGALVIFEGLDRSGKSTQVQRLQEVPWGEPRPVFSHMPSGLTALTHKIYRLTENEPISSDLARQLLHLACHAENASALQETLRTSGLILDRWWWSTVAYGWYGADLAAHGVDESAFFTLINSVWSRLPADLVFLFMTPFERDALNRDAVRRGYAELAARHAEMTIEVPASTPAATTDFLIDQLTTRGLLAEH
jgi:dTMP kinase